ncbi:hypothetical protein RUMHYD_01932 [Blautia hydrogenotrophica DSM 10507]|uniref:Uncharacterized protein n=1 Tax=Blautia hydrogenotrophica (strain DSM 10507 / JCM 14656 / S5a33) TaxID=476272 RepID=C0CM52_BLAHS|nr:hypothetical protein RUMHYD_01932 [Blautia hydrogenotrophica DSM 10507]DAU19163.1 MAG TPA: D-Tyr-tRNATyr deacylase-alpha-barrel, HYDROLASE [Caudoviricetes sp.]
MLPGGKISNGFGHQEICFSVKCGGILSCSVFNLSAKCRKGIRFSYDDYWF